MRLLGVSALLGHTVLSYQVINDARSQMQFLRVRRKNSGFFEETRDDNIERECYEELCSREELSEVFKGVESKIDAEWEKLTRRCYFDRCDAAGTDVCVQTWNKRVCKCKPGYTGDNCDEDVDDCIGDPCNIAGNPKTACENLAGPGFKCVCAAGYAQLEKDGPCLNVDECATDLNTCDTQTSTCKDQPGSFFCDCHEGFIRDNNDNKVCFDNNECETKDTCAHKPNSVCVNTIGSYSCDCASGFSESIDGSCQPSKSACEIYEPDCGHGDCENDDSVDDGYVCSCAQGWAGVNCGVNKNECLDDPCSGTMPICFDTEGSFICCATGEIKGAGNTCERVPVDPCDGCGADQECDPGLRVCFCTDSGYLLNSATGVCEDVNECEEPSEGSGIVDYENPCAEDETCENTIGSYTCVAAPIEVTTEVVTEPGTASEAVPQPNGGNSDTKNDECTSNLSDGEDIDECQTNNGGCMGMCMNYFGSHLCYEELIDEAEFCHHNADMSSEHLFGYNCTCFSPYDLCDDKFSCIATPDVNWASHVHARNNAACAAGQVGIDSSCYEISSSAASYSDAVSACASKGGQLANLQDRYHWWVLGSKIDDGRAPFYISRQSSLNMHVFCDGEALLANPASSMANVPPQLNAVSGAGEHKFVCEF